MYNAVVFDGSRVVCLSSHATTVPSVFFGRGGALYSGYALEILTAAQKRTQ